MQNQWIRAGSYAWTDDSVRLSLHPSHKIVNNFLHIQEIGHFKSYKSYFTERENLESYLIIYTENGEGSIYYQGKQYYLKPKTVCFIDCKNYQYYKTEKELWDFYWVHINGKHIHEYYEDFISSQNICYETKDSTIKQIIQNMIVCQENKTRNTEIITAREIINLLTQIILEKNRSLYEGKEDIPNYIFEIQSFLEENYSCKITLDTISRKFLINKYQMAKEFKKYVGSSVIDYLIEIRIKKAKDLLKYSHSNVSEIANIIGVENVTHFINLFKSRSGVTPLRYRNHWKH